MRRWTAFVLPAILIFAGGVFLARVQGGGTLYADPQCNCAFSSGWTSPPIPCLGQGSVVTETCSAGVRNQPCVLTGTASWTPSIPTTCALNSSQSGVIGPVGTSNNALFFFNASQPQSPMFAYASAPCASTSLGFGWRMDVIHDLQSTNPCTCGGTVGSRLIMFRVWTCDL